MQDHHSIDNQIAKAVKMGAAVPHLRDNRFFLFMVSIDPDDIRSDVKGSFELEPAVAKTLYSELGKILEAYERRYGPIQGYEIDRPKP